MYDIDYAKDVKTYCRGFGERREELMKHLFSCFEESVEIILNEQISFIDGEFVIDDDDTFRGVYGVRGYIFDNEFDVWGEDYRDVSNYAFSYLAPRTTTEYCHLHNIEYCETIYAILLPHIISEFGADFIDFDKQKEKGDEYMMCVITFWFIHTYGHQVFDSWIADKQNNVNQD